MKSQLIRLGPNKSVESATYKQDRKGRGRIQRKSYRNLLLPQEC